ncbi:MAG TPA: hypothetical protein VHY37_04425 [Tepidisphaeraceae bacterium]|nr:hypothetical protein [Tepidisphaeraceae bacterium]
MTRSIFDPSGRETEHSGSRYTPPFAADDSHLPPDIADGKVENDPGAPDTSPELKEIAEDEAEVDADQARTTPAD